MSRVIAPNGVPPSPAVWFTRHGPVSWVVAIGLAGVVLGVLTEQYPDSLLGLALGGTWTVVLVKKLYGVIRRSLGHGVIGHLAVAGLVVRLPMLLVHLAIGFLVYGGQVDFTTYFTTASRYGKGLLTGDFDFFSLPFSQPTHLGWAILDRILALNYVLLGPSMIGMFLVSGLIGFLGSYLFLRAFQIQFPGVRQERFVALTLFLFPALVFWTSILGKDSWVYMLLGLATYSVANILRSPRGRDLCALVVSVVVIGAFRAPIGLALIAALAVAFLMRLRVHVKQLSGRAAILGPLVYLSTLTVILGVGGVSAVGYRYLEGAREGVALGDYILEAAVNKHVGLSAETEAGGSSLPLELIDPSLGSILAFLPKGMFTALFRPLLFEAHNVVALVASLESTVLLVLVVVRLPAILRAFRLAPSHPFITFYLVAFFLLTAALSFQWNFGVLVRHRTMALPFLFLLAATPVVVPRTPSSRSVPQPEEGRVVS